VPGPHLASTGRLDPQAFKLTRVSGAYWRGDQKNAMLSRIYGTGWLSKKQLDAHLTRLEEAAKRDHRRIAQEMDCPPPRARRRLGLLASQGLSAVAAARGLYAAQARCGRLSRGEDAAIDGRAPVGGVRPLGQISREYVRRAGRDPNAEEEGPILSGEAELMALKPMNCPAHVLIFRQGIKSYRDLPMRLAEFGCCHRNEPHGALHGIMRVRQFTQDDAHIFCREDQIVEEVRLFCNLLDDVYKDLGFASYAIKLALRPEKRFGTEEMWDKAEQNLRDAVAQAAARGGIWLGGASGEGALLILPSSNST